MKKNLEEQTTDNIFERRKFEIAGVVIIVLGILAECSFFTDIGIVGDWTAYGLKLLFGRGRYAVPILIVLWGFTIVYRSRVNLRLNSRYLGLMILFMVLLAIFHLEIEHPREFEAALVGKGGGLAGGLFLYSLRKAFAEMGSYIVLGAAALIGGLLLTDLLLVHIMEAIKAKYKALKDGINRLKNKVFNNKKKEEKERKEKKSWREKFFSLFKKKKDSSLEEVEEENNSSTDLKEDNPTAQVAAAEEEVSDRKQQFLKAASSSHNSQVQQKLFEEAREAEGYKLPPLSLLNKVETNKASFADKTEVLKKTLENFGVEAEVTDVNHGPTITRYEIEPAPGVKVSKIVNLADDIALSLAASDVRIEAPIPGKSAVGIEIPNEKQALVTLREVLATEKFKQAEAKLSLGLGKDIAGQPVVANLAEMPHMLVAGATGSGKSVFINSIINSILQKATPEEVKFLLIDPKMVELTAYKGIPHLVSPVVTDAKKAATALRWVVKEMENRYELFAESGARGIESYNQKNDDEPLPYIVVIIDELADLMMVAAKEVEDAICRLAQKARAAGIHMVLATQRPSVDVVTGVIKANIPNRVSFALSSQADSRTILDTGGAEKLLGQGDMLYAPVNSNQPKRMQGAFISEAEIKRVVQFVKQQDEPDYADKIAKIKDKSVEVELDDEKDELYGKAVKLVVNNRASISFLQRRLSIGYNRAARMIDRMEEENIVGPHRGSKAREVLVNPEDLDEILD